MSRIATHFTIGCLVICLLLSPVAGSQTLSGKDVVAPEAFASEEPVARGMSFQIAVVMKIRSGFHVNAREVTEDYLIPTDLRVELPAVRRAAKQTTELSVPPHAEGRQVRTRPEQAGA